VPAMSHGRCCAHCRNLVICCAAVERDGVMRATHVLAGMALSFAAYMAFELWTTVNALLSRIPVL